MLCSTEFRPAPTQNPNQKLCSRACATRQRRQNTAIITHPEGHRVITQQGYVRIKVGKSWDMEHRIVMQRMLGRKLEPHERVHHRDGVKANNDPDNLELWKLKTHDPGGIRASDYHCAGCRCSEMD